MKSTLLVAAALAVAVPRHVYSQAATARPADPDASAPAASPAQNRQPKQLPPPGIAIPDKDRAELTAAAAELRAELDAFTTKAAKKPALLEHLPDVEVFHKAVDWALRYNEFYNLKEVGIARDLLKEGRARAAALREGRMPWTTQTGPVVRGYRSNIDGSVQPYGVVVPPTWKGAVDKEPRAVWIWNHGRGDTLTELAFLAQRMKSPGEFTPVDTFVLHPYGRYCNATKFAGERDVFEVLKAAEGSYPLDGYRRVNAGFSMGGASAWHLGGHFPTFWAATHAGAGFAETAEYAGVFAKGKTPPPWWEQVLWRWYDATVYAANFSNSPAFAYHGAEDKQGQATTIMKRFAEKEGVTIEEFVGPGVGHKYEPKTKQEIAAKIDAVLAKERRSDRPTVHLTTYTTRYHEAGWIQIWGMERHWERADVDGELTEQNVALTTKNVTRLLVAANGGRLKNAVIDGQNLKIDGTAAYFVKRDGKWGTTDIDGLFAPGKRHGLAGPIDDAFMDSFVFVKPTGKPFSPELGAWTQRELDHAIKQWRGIFRGDAVVKLDSEIASAGSGRSHLVLWGDPSSNAVLKKIADRLPVKWTKDGVEFGGKKYGPGHVPILIFPNPLSSGHYVVLNSGFTFNRAAASGTNSQQTPKLPDWAIVDTSVPPDDKFPGKIVEAGFFDEGWNYTEEQPK